jgi:heme/copper-type cytochrome/quinol oxidase subunit 1
MIEVIKYIIYGIFFIVLAIGFILGGFTGVIVAEARVEYLKTVVKTLTRRLTYYRNKCKDNFQ